MFDPRFYRGPGRVSSLGLHMVWCPKYRRRLLGLRVAARLHELLDDIAVDNDWQIVAREVMPDRLHIFVRVRPADAPATVARGLKGRPSRVLRAEFPWLGPERVLWSKSYFAASVGCVSEATVGRYIDQQCEAA